MAKDPGIEGLRREYVKSIYGRRLGMDVNDNLLGPQSFRIGGEGLSSVGSTFPSSSVVTTLSKTGYSLIGTTGSSGTTIDSTATQQLPAPQPGVEKIISNISTAHVGISTVTASAFFSASDSSTYQYANFTGRASLRLLGISTANWLVINNDSFNTVEATSVASTSTNLTRAVVFL